MSTQSAGQQVVLVGPNGQTEPVSLEQLDIYASVLGTESDAFSNISKAGDVLSDMYDKTEAALASTYDNASQVVSEGYKSVSDWAGNTSDAAKQWGQDTYEVVEQWGVETADATRTKVIQLSEDAQLKWDAFKKEAEIAKEQAAKKAEELAIKTDEFIEEKKQQYYELTGDKGIDFGSTSSASTIDPETGRPNCECQSIEPCCVRLGSIADTEDKTRKLEWPVKNGDPTNLLLIADKRDLVDLREKVTVSTSGKNNENCVNKYKRHPCVSFNSDEDFITEKELDYSIDYGMWDKLALAATPLIPPAVLGVVSVGYKFIDLSCGNHLQNGNSFGIKQCVTNDCFKNLNVYLIPFIKLEGEVAFEPSWKLDKNGLQPLEEKKWLAANVTGQYGDFVFSSEQDISPKSTRTTKEKPKQEPGAVWFFKTVENLIKVLDSKSGRDESIPNESSPAKLIISPKLSAVFSGVELKKVTGKPDICLEAGAFKMGYGLTIDGTLDLLYLVILALVKSKKIADVIQQAREELENREGNSAALKADLIFKGTGERYHETGASFRVDLLSDGSKKISSNAFKEEIKSEIKITANLEAVIKARGKVVIVEAALSMKGSLNTAWVWQFKSSKNDTTGESEKYRRFIFEGLKLKATYAYTVSSSTTVRGPKNSDNGYADIGSEVEQKLETDLITKEWVLLEPTVKRIEDDMPAWERDV